MASDQWEMREAVLARDAPSSRERAPCRARAWALLLALLPLLVGLAPAAAARAAAPSPPPPDEEDLLPLDDLRDRDRARVERVIASRTFRREIPHTPVLSRADIYDWLLDRLPLASRILRGLGLGDYAIDDLEDGRCSFDDGAGITATIEPIHHDGPLRIYYIEGTFDLRSMRLEIPGSVVISLRYDECDDGTLDTWAVAYFRVENRILHRLGRILEPLLGQILDDKSVAFVSAAREMTERAAASPEAFALEMEAMSDVTAEDVAEFRSAFAAGE